MTKLRYFDDRAPGFHMQPRVIKPHPSPLDNPGGNPAFTIRRHLLQAKEDTIQIDQMKKVSPKKTNEYLILIIYIDFRQ